MIRKSLSIKQDGKSILTVWFYGDEKIVESAYQRIRKSVFSEYSDSVGIQILKVSPDNNNTN